MSVRALLNTLGNRSRTLPLVILYVTEGCNLRCISCSYRAPAPGEMTLGEITPLAAVLKAGGLRHIVYSGGEPLLRRDFPEICRLFAGPPVRQTLLTNGLLLEKRFSEVESLIGEFIVSLDGPDAPTHDTIRGVESFDIITRGIARAVSSERSPNVTLRTVIQKRNFRSLIRMVKFARAMGVRSVSFLAADVRSRGFGRVSRGAVAEESDLLLDADETLELRAIIGEMESSCAGDFRSGFIAESPGRLRQIAEYFEAMIGWGPLPPTVCNAPMVSAVITATGDLLPCYFLPPFGNIRKSPLDALLNGEEIRRTRADVRHGAPEECRRCVCTLHVSPARALLGRW